jgi:hypothetical protein
VEPLLAAWRAGGLDALTVSSSEGLRYLVDLLDADGCERLRDTPVFVPHARIVESAQALGGELRDTPATDAPNTGAGDHHKAEAIRLWIAANVMEVTNHEYGNERGAEARH